jgi:hypothetical protein
MVDGGVGRGMGSNGKKGSRKEAAPKRPGPTPAQPLKKRCKADAKAAKVEKMNNHNERKKMDKLILGNLKSKDPNVQQSVVNVQQSVVNARGRSRGFHENCLFLTLFCSLYKEAAAEMDTLCAHLATSRAPCARATRAHPCGCLAVSAARRRIHASTSRS